MRRVLISFVIVGAFASSAICLAEGESEIPVESGESAIEVVPAQVQLPAEIEAQLNRLFDPYAVFASEALFKMVKEHIKVSSMKAARISSLDRPGQQAPDIGREIHNRLIEGLGSEHLEIRRRIALTLNAIGDKSGVPVMIEAMDSDDSSNRADAVVTLRKIKDRRAIPALIKAVDDKSPYIRCIAIEALGEMKADEANDVIVKHLNDKEKVKGADIIMLPAKSACFALGEIRERRPKKPRLALFFACFSPGRVYNRISFGRFAKDRKVMRYAVLHMPIPMGFAEKVSVRYPITTNTLNGCCYGTLNINTFQEE